MMAKDPVCGMEVDTETARVKGSYAGKMVYFCSEACQMTYDRRHKRDP